MAEVKERPAGEVALYERDYALWVEEQVRLLQAGRFDQLDLPNLIDEVEDLSRSERRAIGSDLVVVLVHLLKHEHQPEMRSRSWLSSIIEHRRRLRKSLQQSPSLRRHAEAEFDECYRDAKAQAAIETGLPLRAFPESPPFSLDQALDPEFLPD
jgi:hypothetical protein